MKFTENRKVENTYRENPDLDKALRYHGMNLYADQKPYALVLTKEDGSVFGEIPVDFYFDAVAIHEDVLYVGLRDGEVLKCSLDPCRVESKFFLSLEVWQSLFDHESIIEGTRQVVKRHELGRKENMAMANILNDHCFESAVTRIAGNGDLLAVGDVFGRVAVFSVDDLKQTVDFGSVGGAVIDLSWKDDHSLSVTWVAQKGAADPFVLTQVPDAYTEDCSLAMVKN